MRCASSRSPITERHLYAHDFIIMASKNRCNRVKIKRILGRTTPESGVDIKYSFVPKDSYSIHKSQVRHWPKVNLGFDFTYFISEFIVWCSAKCLRQLAWCSQFSMGVSIHIRKQPCLHPSHLSFGAPVAARSNKGDGPCSSLLDVILFSQR